VVDDAFAEALGQVEILRDTPPKRALVDRSYRGHGVKTTEVFISGQRRGLIPAPPARPAPP